MNQKYLIILPFLWWAFNVNAQEPQELSSMPEQWQLTLDVIKAKAQDLVVKNNGLQLQYQKLTGQVQELQQAIDEQQYKNDQLDRFLKDRHGRTDQQIRIEELTQRIKTKGQEAGSLDEQLGAWRTKQLNMERKTRQLKNMVSEQGRRQPAEEQAPVVQSSDNSAMDDLSGLRKQLDDETRQEAALASKLKDMQDGENAQQLNEQTIAAQNKELEARLDVLRQQKSQRTPKYTQAQLAQAAASRFDQLKKRKDALEDNINVYESRLDQLREASLQALSWTLKRKQLIHDLVIVDASNNKLRDKIKEIREDIDVLKDQVAKLERRFNFVKAQATGK